MMTNIQKWFLIWAMWVVILALIFTFYWNQVRPINIRKMCGKRAAQATQAIKPSGSNIHEIYRAIYSDCCRNNGLKD